MVEKNLEELFKNSADLIKKEGPNLNLTNDDLLVLYGYYKQATVGDCNEPEPGLFDLRGKAKYTAWKENIGISKENAMKKYNKKVSKLVEKK